MKKHHYINRALLCASISAVISSGTINASVLEEVVVTAQKREQNLQDVGISVSAMSGDQMTALGLDNTQEITQQVPGLQVQTFSPAYTIFNLRGISQNNFQDNLEAPVAAYFDDVYVGSMNAIGGQIYDMERTEVLRGPQGTLFGRNATGGLIHFVTRKADDEEFNGFVRAEVSEYDSYNIEAAFGGALSESVRYRLAGRWEQSDGYLEAGPLTPEGQLLVDDYNFLPPGTTPPGGDGSDSNGADSYGVRGSLQIDVSDSSLLDLMASYSKDDDAPVGQYLAFLPAPDPATGLSASIDPDNPITGDVHKHAGGDVSIGGEDTGLDREMTSLTARWTSELSNGMEFTSISNWLDMEKSHREDAGAGALPFAFLTEAEYTQWSQEFRLSGESEGFRWQLGAYYLDIELESRAATGGILFTASDVGFIDALTDLDSTNWSVFGQAEYDLGDELTLIAGYRWSQDDKDIEFQNVAGPDVPGAPEGTVLFDVSQSAVGAFAGVDEIDYGDFAARLQLNWQMNDETLAYLSYNRGIKGGNWTPASTVSIESFQHDEEVLHSYELGVKTTLAEGRARLNANVYYYDYKDYQAFSIVNFTAQVANTDATSQGGEIELTLLPNEHWDIMLGVSFIDSEVDEIQTPLPGVLLEDTEFPQAPGYSFNYLVRYNWDMFGGNMAAQLDGVYNDEQFLEAHNGASSFQDSYGMTNASISFTDGEGEWDIRAWVKNLTDEEVAMYNVDIQSLVIRQYMPPRWYGLTVSYNW